MGANQAWMDTIILSGGGFGEVMPREYDALDFAALGDGDVEAWAASCGTKFDDTPEPSVIWSFMNLFSQ